MTSTTTTRPTAQPGLAGGLIRTARPKQWAKNVLVLAAPAAAGSLTETVQLAHVAAALVSFCALSSATYFVNDVLDAEADRNHSTKKHRPVAAGVVSRGLALACALLLAVGGIALAASVRIELAAVAAAYLALTSAYSTWLKHLPLFDITAIAAGFVLRAFAGAVAASVPVSDWFLIITCFGSLFVATGKRQAELAELQADGRHVRVTLQTYTDSYLGYLRSVSSGIVMVAYCLWAVERADLVGGSPWTQLSIVPFVLAVLRYAMLLDQGQGAVPEDLVLGDRHLIGFAAAWTTLMAVGIYLAGV